MSDNDRVGYWKWIHGGIKDMLNIKHDRIFKGFIMFMIIPICYIVIITAFQVYLNSFSTLLTFVPIIFIMSYGYYMMVVN